MDIQPGSSITLEITGTPRTSAATKTLVRLCRRDPQVMRRQRKQDRTRPSWQTWRRGGRFWHHQMKSGTGVALVPGQRYSMLATVDVLRDLESVKRWVKVSLASES